VNDGAAQRSLLRPLGGRASEGGGSRLGSDLPKEKYLLGSGTNGNGFRLAGSAAGFGSPPIALSHACRAKAERRSTNRLSAPLLPNGQ